MRALVNILFHRRSAARPAIDLLESAGLVATEPVWGDESVARPWLVQVECPERLTDGVVPVEAVLKIIRRVVHLHDGHIVPDVPEVKVVVGKNYTTRPGGPPFMNGLSRDVIRAYERSLIGGSEANGDVPLFENDASEAPE